MDRRSLITAFTGLGTTFLAGCASTDGESFDPDIAETIRLGTAEPLSLNQEVDVSNHYSQNFKAKATERANVRVHDHIGVMLREQELFGAGVFLGIDHISAEEIDDEVEEEEFERAKPLATVINQRYVYTEDGELITRPKPVELETLRAQLPPTVTVDVVGDSDQYTAVLPVVIHRFWVHPAQK